MIGLLCIFCENPIIEYLVIRLTRYQEKWRNDRTDRIIRSRGRPFLPSFIKISVFDNIICIILELILHVLLTGRKQGHLKSINYEVAVLLKKIEKTNLEIYLNLAASWNMSI